jgi:2-amino-4-hydroxy-6-hydroxymethyldihydropteridine diphosphokinase
MARCLLGLGSNLGDREMSLAAALAAIDALPDVLLRRQSEWHPSAPLGGPPGQAEFLNGAALIETTIPPLTLLAELKDIESRHGRQPAQRWAPRPIDIDVLLYDDEVAETAMLTLPHPRMSFRRFVLAPAAEIAPRMLHPTIGWPVERLLLHLDAASDQVVLVSPSDALRRQLVQSIAGRFGAQETAPPTFATAERLWPQSMSSWIAMPPSTRQHESPASERLPLPYAAAAFPKLTILLDSGAAAEGAAKSQWTTVARQPGRGPTLRLQTADQSTIETEVAAAIESVW